MPNIKMLHPTEVMLVLPFPVYPVQNKRCRSKASNRDLVRTV